MNTKVYLLGYMGVGKSTIGKRIAARLAVSFIDLDRLIVARAGMEINEIFDKEGEKGFREIESNILKEVASSPGPAVISTGGGAPCSNKNISLILQSGIAVWLKMDEKQILGRLKQGREHRPLIANLSDSELSDYIAKHLLERNGFYAKAHIHFSADNPSAQAMDQLEKEIKNYSR